MPSSAKKYWYSRCHIKKRTLPHGHNFLLFRYIPIGGNHSPCENAHQQPQCPWGLDKSWATHGPSWSQQMIPISMLVLGYALNCREILTFQTLGFGILVFGNNGAQCACKDNFQNEVVFLQVAFSRKWSRRPWLFSSNIGNYAAVFRKCLFQHLSVHFNMCPKNSFEHPMDSHGQTAWHSKKHSRTRAPCPDCLPAAKNFKNMMLPGVDGFFGSIWFENMRVLMQLLTYGIMRCFSCCWIADLGMLKNVG